MTDPSIASRQRRRFVAVSADQAFVACARAVLPGGWEIACAGKLAELGGFADVLQHRFVLLDLDGGADDPIGVIHEARRELMLNIAIFCFGGTAALRGEARMAGADRFFERDELAERTRQFCEQYGW